VHAGRARVLCQRFESTPIVRGELRPHRLDPPLELRRALEIETLKKRAAIEADRRGELVAPERRRKVGDIAPDDAWIKAQRARPGDERRPERPAYLVQELVERVPGRVRVALGPEGRE
jgi:hypothetical protein